MAEDNVYLWIMRQIMPAPGWRAVIWDAGGHIEHGLHGLALVHERERHGTTLRVIPQRTTAEDEQWLIVGLRYTPLDGWEVVDSLEGFCGLIPPEMTMDDFMILHRCSQVPA